MSDLLYGIHPVSEAFAAGKRRFKALYISKRRGSKGIDVLLKQAKARAIPITYEGDSFFRSHLGSATHQGVAARVGPLPVGDQTAILKRAEQKAPPVFVLVLDGITDPQNLGSLVRTALAMGVQAITIAKHRCAPLSPAVSKASSGAMEHMTFWRVSNIVAALRRLRQTGLWIVGTDMRSGGPVYQADLTVSLALVLGGEEKGIRPLVRKTCDFLVSIPQAETIDSLNAAVAGAMVMYEVVRQRMGGH